MNWGSAFSCITITSLTMFWLIDSPNALPSTLSLGNMNILNLGDLKGSLHFLFSPLPFTEGRTEKNNLEPSCKLPASQRVRSSFYWFHGWITKWVYWVKPNNHEEMKEDYEEKQNTTTRGCKITKILFYYFIKNTWNKHKITTKKTQNDNKEKQSNPEKDTNDYKRT